MKYLKIAEQYAEKFGAEDSYYFKNLYTRFRQYNDVKDSVWKTLSYLYGNDTADMLEEQAWMYE